MKTSLLLLLSIAPIFLFAQQTILTDSNLPILVIETDINFQNGQQYEINDDVKVPATMKLIYRPDGSRNYLTDITNPNFLDYSGKIVIEFRGSSSQFLEKKPYGFTTKETNNVTNKNVSLLGMPSENDWVLNSLAFEPSMIRDVLSYDLSRSLNNYASPGHYVEVVSNGDYKGVYILMEKIKRDKNRINVLEMTIADNLLPDLSGGYVVKCDKLTGGDEVAWQMDGLGGASDFIFESPKPADITIAQEGYIQNYFLELKERTYPSNPDIEDGYPDLIDIPSFIDFMLISEISSNVDSYSLSTYFHKDRNGKLRAGPIWDYNLTYGNDLLFWGYDRSHFDVWQFDNGDNTGPYFWFDLFNDPTFNCLLARRWFEVTAAGQPLNYASIESIIDYYTNLLNESADRENERWGTVGDRLNNVNEMKVWLQQRIDWMNDNIGNPAACSNPVLPNLVITKIHYNPQDKPGFLSNELEFIEITNNSNATVDLTGIYIRELGISFKFAAGSTIAANQAIMLAANSDKFTAYYGYAPFAEYTRTLSNNDYHIVLSDALGNTIDEVHYFDNDPWPGTADGEGFYLSLVDINSDNALAINWIGGGFASIESFEHPSTTLSVYPNPVENELNLIAENQYIRIVRLRDTQGRLVLEHTFPNSGSGQVQSVNIGSLKQGVYLLEVELMTGLIIQKNIAK